jgi:hypothetical protein
MFLKIYKIEEAKNILKIYNMFSPERHNLNLINYGSSHDGGYLLPENLGKIDGVISGGCNNNSDFETSILDKTGIESNIFDEKSSFSKAKYKSPKHKYRNYFLGFPQNRSDGAPEYISLCKALDLSNFRSKNNLILKLDIEGSEYVTLIMTPMQVLKKFKFICIEFHNLNELKYSKQFRSTLSNVLRTLIQNHQIISAIGNNSTGQFGILARHKFHFRKINLPNTLEISLVRKTFLKKVRKVENRMQKLPNRQNNPNLKELYTRFPYEL